jgi:urease accessory protein
VTARLSETTRSGWRAALWLRYRADGPRTVVQRRHEGPLVVQRSLYPEGPAPCQNIVVHPPGGIAGGDALAIDVDVGAGASAQITTPGATKWYRSDGLLATQDVRLRVGPAAALEWLPQESIVFDRVRARQRTRIELASSSRYMGWEIFCLGRGASGERLLDGVIESATELVVDSEMRWVERSKVEGGARLLTSRAGLAGERVFGTLLAFGDPRPDELVSLCRNIAPRCGEAAATTVGGLLVARILGGTTETARAWFEGVWVALRSRVIGRAPMAPRIWRT